MVGFLGFLSFVVLFLAVGGDEHSLKYKAFMSFLFLALVGADVLAWLVQEGRI